MVTYPRFANHDYRLSLFTLEQSSHPAAIPLDGVQPSAGCLQVSSKRPDVRLVRSVVVVILVTGNTMIVDLESLRAAVKP